MLDKLKNKKNLIFIILILLFLSTRILILYTSPYLYRRDECYIGTIAKELIDGPKFSFFQYQYSDHYPGSLFSGVITVPFFLVFGQSGISLKLVGLFIALLTLIVIYFFLNKFFNQKSAVFFALLFIFSMPFYTIHHLTSLGIHAFPLLFDAIIMFLFYNIFFDNKKDFKHFLLFGFMCGFAAWFCFQSLVMIFTCLLFWFVFDKKFFLRKYFFIFVVFFLVGFSPGIYYNFTHEFSGILNHKMEGGLGNIDFNSNLIIKAGYKLFNILNEQLPISFSFKNFGFLSENFLSYLYYFIFLFAIFVILWYCRKSFLKLMWGIIPLERNNVSPRKIKKESFILAYIFIFLVIYSFSNFEFKTYYMLALYPFILIILSLFIAKLWNKKALRLISIFIITILLLTGLTGNLGLISFSNLSKGGKIYEPYCYYLLAQVVGDKIHTIKFAIPQCNRFDLEHRKYCYVYFSEKICKGCNYNISCYINSCNKFELGYKKYCYEGLGRCIYNEYSNNLTGGLNICNLFNRDYKNYCCKGFCEKIGSLLGSDIQEGIKRCNKMNSECRDYCYDGLALYIDEISRENYLDYPEDYPNYPEEDTEKCTQLERRLIVSRVKTICFLKLVNSNLNISSNESVS